MKRRDDNGFTLVELLVTVVVMIVVVAVGVPMFRSIISNNQLAAQTNTLVTALNLARGEALKRATTVSVCKKGDDLSCNSDDNNWGTGLIVFEDLNSDGVLDEGETVIRVWDAVAGDPTISAINKDDDSGVSVVTFDVMGFKRDAGDVWFTVQSTGPKGCNQILDDGSEEYQAEWTRTNHIILAEIGQVTSEKSCDDI